MERPKNIKDKQVLEYIEHLESLLRSDATKKKLWRGIQRQLDILADELLSDHFRLSLKSDNELDRFLKILEKGKQIIDSMQNFETEAFPKGKNEIKKLSTESAENYLTNAHP